MRLPAPLDDEPRRWAQNYPCWTCGQKSRYRFPVWIEATCWDCWLKDHDDTRAFMFGHPWPRFRLFRPWLVLRRWWRVTT